MKKFMIIAAAALSLAACTKQKAQLPEMKVGQMTAYELDGFRLHVYNTNDVMGDASYIIEGKKGLVVMEYPLFKDNAAEFAEYITALEKPVVTDVTDYHLGGSDKLPLTMPEGMPAFIEGPVYSGMMSGFAQAFGVTMVDLPTQKAAEVPFDATQEWAGRFGRPMRAGPSSSGRSSCRLCWNLLWRESSFLSAVPNPAGRRRGRRRFCGTAPSEADGGPDGATDSRRSLENGSRRRRPSGRPPPPHPVRR